MSECPSQPVQESRGSRLCRTLLHAEGDEFQLPRLRNVWRGSENQNLVCLQSWSSQQCGSRLSEWGELLEWGKIPLRMYQQQEKPPASWSDLHVPRAAGPPWGHRPGRGAGTRSGCHGALGTGKSTKMRKITNFNKEMCAMLEKGLRPCPG